MAGIHVYLKEIYSRKTYSLPMIILYSVTLVKHRPSAKKGSSVCLNRTTKVPFPVRCIQIFILLHGLTQHGACRWTLRILFLCEPHYLDVEMLGCLWNNTAFLRDQRFWKLDGHQSCPEPGAFRFLSCECKE